VNIQHPTSGNDRIIQLTIPHGREDDEDDRR
jgi:hypothetical protein